MDGSSTADTLAVIDLVNAIFDGTDAKDWGGLAELFEDVVDVDFTSLAGGEPARIPATALIDGWRTGLHARKRTLHLAGNHRVRLSGDTATVTVKGYAFNALDAGLGGGVWEVWGAYRVGAHRSPAGWRCTAFAFDAWRTAGDDAVRTHVLV